MFAGFTTTVSASLATCSSSKAIPLAWHCWRSLSEIGREALEMSVSPLQNFWNPPPVPEVPTVTFTSGFSPW